MRNRKLEYKLIMVIIAVIAIIIFLVYVIMREKLQTDNTTVAESSTESTELPSAYTSTEVPGVTVEAEDSTNTLASELANAKETNDYSKNNNDVADGPASLKNYWDYTCENIKVTDSDIANVPTSLSSYYVYNREETSNVVSCCKALSQYLGKDINATVTEGNIQQYDYTFGTLYNLVLNVDNINYLIYMDDTTTYIKEFTN